MKANRDADAYTAQGAAKQAEGDLNGAIADFTQAIQLQPEDAEAYRSRGLANRAKNNIYSARADLDKAMELESAAK